jgi:hypothetical protein
MATVTKLAELQERLRPQTDAVAVAERAHAEAVRELAAVDSTNREIRNTEKSITETNSRIVDKLADGAAAEDLKSEKADLVKKLAALRQRIVVSGSVAARQATWHDTRRLLAMAASELENDCRSYVGGRVGLALVELEAARREYLAISALLTAAGGRPPELSALGGLDPQCFPDLSKFVQTTGESFNYRRGADRDNKNRGVA